MTCHRLFTLQRAVDHSGISGTGAVAEGVQFSDGTVVLHWHGPTASTVVWGSLADAVTVHGHHGDTTVVWADGPDLPHARLRGPPAPRTPADWS